MMLCRLLRKQVLTYVIQILITGYIVHTFGQFLKLLFFSTTTKDSVDYSYLRKEDVRLAMCLLDAVSMR